MNPPLANGDEYLDLVNEKDEVIGRKLRSEVYAENLSNFRVVNAFVINSEGKIFTPRRAPTKKIFPLCLDMSMGGHVESGETYEESFKRELSEELNIDADIVSWRCIGKMTPEEDGVSANMHVYEVYVDIVPDFNKNDFIEFFWFTPKELLELISKGEKSKQDLPKIVSKFYSQ